MYIVYIYKLVDTRSLVQMLYHSMCERLLDTYNYKL